MITDRNTAHQIYIKLGMKKTLALDEQRAIEKLRREFLSLMSQHDLDILQDALSRLNDLVQRKISEIDQGPRRIDSRKETEGRQLYLSRVKAMRNDIARAIKAHSAESARKAFERWENGMLVQRLPDALAAEQEKTKRLEATLDETRHQLEKVQKTLLEVQREDEIRNNEDIVKTKKITEQKHEIRNLRDQLMARPIKAMPPVSDLRALAGECRMKNGKINYLQLSKRLRCSNKTAKKWCEDARIT